MSDAAVDHGAEKQREHGQTDNLKSEHWTSPDIPRSSCWSPV
jgi:hypothetical protein